jgi:type I restriction enzyme, S subunit
MTADMQTLLVPKLRFSMFSGHGSWDVKRLDDLCDRLSLPVGETQLTPVSISAGKGFVPQSEKFGRDISGGQYSKYIWLQCGDFAYNRGNSKRFPQGCVYQLKELDEAAASNAFYCFRLHGNVKPAFILGFFENNGHGRQLIRDITSGARSNGLLNISADTFFGITVLVPPTAAEQQRIADCLSSLDDLISAEDRKLNALRQYKEGLVQQLFPQEGEAVPRVRFPEFRDKGEWEERKAGSLFLNRVEKGEEGLPIYSVTMHDGMVRRNSLDRNFNDIEEAAGNKKVRKNDIAYNMMRMWQGALGVAPEDCLVSPAYIVLAPQKHVVSRFFEYLFKLPTSLLLLTSHSRGLTKDRLRLYYDDFARIPLRCPSEPEQQRIADCMCSLDSCIAGQARKLNVLSLHKQGLLQQLFPSPEEEGSQ